MPAAKPPRSLPDIHLQSHNFALSKFMGLYVKKLILFQFLFPIHVHTNVLKVKIQLQHAVIFVLGRLFQKEEFSITCKKQTD